MGINLKKQESTEVINILKKNIGVRYDPPISIKECIEFSITDLYVKPSCPLNPFIKKVREITKDEINIYYDYEVNNTDSYENTILGYFIFIEKKEGLTKSLFKQLIDALESIKPYLYPQTYKEKGFVLKIKSDFK